MGYCTEIKGDSLPFYLHKGAVWETPGIPSPKEPAIYVESEQHVNSIENNHKSFVDYSRRRKRMMSILWVASGSKERLSELPKVFW